MNYVIWVALGIFAVIPLLVFANRLKYNTMIKLLGRSLVAAAMIYVGFALAWGDNTWLVIEISGIIVYGLFYALSIKYNAIWLAFGWLLHPVWDVILHLFGPGTHVVPSWYAVACVSFDITVAAYIFYRMKVHTYQM